MSFKPGYFVAGLAFCLIAGQAAAQSVAAPSAEAIATARILVDKQAAGGTSTMNGLALPFPHLMKELGVTDPTHFGVLIHEGVMPVVSKHADELTEIQVKSTASLLSVKDMKAAIAFFDSPAGQDLVRLKFKLLQTNMNQAADLIESLKPDIKVQAEASLKAHGWNTQ